MVLTGHLLPRTADEPQPRKVITRVDLKRGQAPQHVTGEKVMPGMAGSVDRQAVIEPRRPVIAHIGMEPPGQPCPLAERRSHISGNTGLTCPPKHLAGHFHM